MKHVPTMLFGLVGLGLLAVSCASNSRDAEDPTEIIRASTSTRVDPSTIEFGPDDIVWQAHTGGGDLPETSLAAEVPSLTIYGDGRLFLSVPGVDRRFDQPVPMLFDQLDTAALTRFLAAAEGTGLFEPHVDFGEPAEEELPTTTVRLRRNGDELAIQAYGLGARFDVDLTEEQIEQREALRQLLSAAEQLAVEPEPWVPERVRILQFADDAPFVQSPEADPEDPLPVWSGPELDEILTRGEGPGLACGELDGTEARDVFESGLQNPTPRWDVDGATRTLVMSVVLPGDVACSGP